MNRISICNHLIATYGLDSYLEIGVRRKSSMFDRIVADHKKGIDPDPRAQADYTMTSDEYFADHDDKFDLIFVDGAHLAKNVKRDISNGLKCLTNRGMILLHDMNPPTAFHARETYEVNGTFPSWNGTSWQGYAWYRKHCPDLEMYVVDCDYGVGFVRWGSQDTWDGPIEGYEDLEANREELLNLISVEEFLERHK